MLKIIIFSKQFHKILSRILLKVRGPFVQNLCIEKDSYMDAL